MADDKKKKPASTKKSATKRATTRKTTARKTAATKKKDSPASASRASKAARKPTARLSGAKAPGARKKATAKASSARRTDEASPSASASASAGAHSHSAGTATARVENFGKAIDISNLAEKLWRGLSMIVFGIVGSWAYVAQMILAAVQFVVVLFTDKPSDEINRYTGICRIYLGQVLDLLSYRTETLPWPLGPLPGPRSSKD